MKKNNLKRLSLFAFVLTLLLTGGIFAYWAANVIGSDEEVATAITIGQGETATTTISLNEASKTQGKLVPAGYGNGGTNVEEIVIVFEVALLADQAGASGAEANLVVTIIETGHALINAAIDAYEPTIVAGGPAVVVQIRITLTEPANQEEYDEVANKDFDIKVQFEAII